MARGYENGLCVIINLAKLGLIVNIILCITRKNYIIVESNKTN